MKRVLSATALCAALALALTAPARADFGFQSLEGGALDSADGPLNAAGAHPHTFVTEFTLSTVPVEVPPELEGSVFDELPDGDLRDVIVTLPPGFLGDPTAVPTCAAADFAVDSAGSTNCPSATQIGTAVPYTEPLDDPNFNPIQEKIYNLIPGFGTAARFGFWVGGVVPVILDATLTPSAPYRAIVRATDTAQILSIYGVRTEFWGIPASSAHNAERGEPSTAPLAPFLSLPTRCDDPLRTDIEITSWEGSTDSGFFESVDALDNPTALSDCEELSFDPTLTARPTTNVADSPTGLEVELAVPQEVDCEVGPPAACEPATAHLRDVTVELPEGLTVNAASANGLDACTPEQANLEDPEPAACPDAAKIATVSVDTPLLDHPVPGSVYLATPHENPFNSLLAIYISLDDPVSGTVVKLAGEVTADPATGKLTSTFEDNPQVPFSSFSLDFFSGASAPLRTPTTCGPYTTTSSMTPWSAPASGPPATPSDAWQIAQAPGGGGCPTQESQLPHNPDMDAGSTSPIAGAHSPFVLDLRRDDGSQRFSQVTLNPPPGLTAKLAGTPYCPEGALAAAAANSGKAEQAAPSCPAASRIGQVHAAAGAGPAPYWAPGSAYLTGPYRGAPLSMAIVTPAVAGPFDLGVVVIRTALHLDPRTAEITAVSDPIPAMLQGIPLDVRRAIVRLDRPEFTLNGTSCDPTAVSGALTSTLGAIANLHNRYQLGECTRLGFKPKMALRLRGGTKRGKHPQLTATIIARAGDANIRSVQVALPRSEFLENAHIRTICTRPDFAADNCPKGAVYGRAVVHTPILDEPLTGNVYLRSSDNLLPDLVPDLRGPAHLPLRVETAGRTDSIRGGIRNTFAFIPDAPFSRAVVALQGGNKGLLVNSRDICARTYRARVRFSAHNGRVHTIRPKLVAQGCKKKRGKKRKAKRGGHGRGGKRGAKGSSVALRSAVGGVR